MSATKIEFPNPLKFQDHQEKSAFPAKKAVPFRPKMVPFCPKNALSCAEIEQEERESGPNRRRNSGNTILGFQSFRLWGRVCVSAIPGAAVQDPSSHPRTMKMREERMDLETRCQSEAATALWMGLRRPPMRRRGHRTPNLAIPVGSFRDPAFAEFLPILSRYGMLSFCARFAPGACEARTIREKVMREKPPSEICILVVDDLPENIQVVKAILVPHGYEE